MRRSYILLSVLLLAVAVWSPAVQAQEFACFPSCDPTDSRFVNLFTPGDAASMSPGFMEMQFAVDAGRTEYTLGFFDGDTGGVDGAGVAHWDAPGGDLQITLFADPDRNGTGPVIATFSGNTMPDNAWFDQTFATDVSAQAPSGNYYYHLLVEYVGTSGASLFKLRANTSSSVRIDQQPISLVSRVEGTTVNIVYPDFPNAEPSTYDGTFTTYLPAANALDDLVIWNGDLDYSNCDPFTDDDDPDTPNDVLPDFAVLGTTILEGIASSDPGPIGLDGSIDDTRRDGCGSPEDDSTNVYLARPVAIQIKVTTPTGQIFFDENPSGSQEWEQFRITADPAEVVGDVAGATADFYASELPAGVYRIDILGLDLNNTVFMKYSLPITCVTESGLPCDQPQPYLIGDTVFEDLDGDGVQDAGEVGLQGVVVELLDENGNVIDRTVTDANGEYFFGVDSGTYTVRVAEENLTAIPTGSVGDRVWLDVDGDGVQDAGEPGLANVTVELVDSATGNVIAAQSTDINGNYMFHDLAPGTYQVQVNDATLPAGLVLSGGSDPSAMRTITTDEVFTDLDFGYTNGDATTAMIGDYVWVDADSDGVQDAGEPGIAGVFVELIDTATATVVATTTTDAGGFYLFSGIAAGSYEVRIADVNFNTDQVLEGYTVTAGPQSEGANTSAPRSVVGGDLIVDVDFGYVAPNLFTLSDVVWFDADADGVFDADESGIANVTVNLITGDGVISTTSDASGAFTFTGLEPGSYEIVITDVTAELAGLIGTTQGALDGAVRVSIDNANVSGINFGYVNEGSLSYELTTPGSITDTVIDDNILTYDFGLRPLGSIGDRVWSDLDADGVQDAGENGINGVTVILYDENNVEVDRTTTSGDGDYLFEDLPAGSYTVVIDTATLPADQVPSFDRDGTLDNQTTVDLAPGQIVDDADFGYKEEPQEVFGSIGDRVWRDLDGDGIQDSGEPGINGVTVILLDENGDEYARTTTSGDGNYSFDNLPAGTYTVVVVTDTLPAGVSQTFDRDGTLDHQTTVILTPGLFVDDADFGYQPMGTGTGTPGYWRNHPEAWPVDYITIGGVTYSKFQAIAIIDASVSGDKTYTLAAHLISAKLNVLIGNDGSCIEDAIAAADAWLATYPVGSGVNGNSKAWKKIEPVSHELDAYNNGYLCASSRG